MVSELDGLLPKQVLVKKGDILTASTFSPQLIALFSYTDLIFLYSADDEK
jgi:hypothetical protein